MESRDIITIIIAILIVLVLAMYIKPLVTGKEVKIIPDELAVLFSEENEELNKSRENTSFSTTNSTSVITPSIYSITPDLIRSDDDNSSIEIIGKGFTSSMNISVHQGPEKKILNTSFSEGKLKGHSLNLTEGNWTIKIDDSSTNLTLNTMKNVQVFVTPTPIPPWNEIPKPLNVKNVYNSGSTTQSRLYPMDIVSNKSPMKTYMNFSGVSSVISNPIYIPYSYWDVVYDVEFKSKIANPANQKVFEFNKQYKEPLITYEGEPIIYYEKDSFIPTMMSVKTEVKNETHFKASKDTVLIKTPKDEPNASPPFEVSTENVVPALVETVGYMKPYFEIKIKNVDKPQSDIIIITPEGGIDPLQWDETKHKEEAEKILKQQGKKEQFDSAEYQDEWEKKWKSIKDPRPWKERIFGSGNYSFEILTQSIDSYNIQIEVPGPSLINTISSSNSYSEKELITIKDVLNHFSMDYNNEVNSEYFHNIQNYLSSELSSSEKLTKIYNEYVQARAAGMIVDNIEIYDILIRGYLDSDNKLIQSTEANVKGNFRMNFRNSVKNIPFNLEMIKEDSIWKFKTTPYFQY